MTNSLREELIKYFEWADTKADPEYTTTEVLSIIEKRIDSMKVNEITPYHEVHNKAIDLVKEMLK